MFIYSVKYICGTQAPIAEGCAPLGEGTYSTEINIHNFHPKERAAIEKRVLQLVLNGEPVGREPKIVAAKEFDKIVLPPDSATMDDCCRLGEKLRWKPGSLNVGFLELQSSIELNVTAVYTATHAKSTSTSIEVESVTGKSV